MKTAEVIATIEFWSGATVSACDLLATKAGSGVQVQCRLPTTSQQRRYERWALRQLNVTLLPCRDGDGRRFLCVNVPESNPLCEQIRAIRP